MKPGDLLLCLDWQWLYLYQDSGAANVKVLNGHFVLVLQVGRIRSLVMSPNGLGWVHLDRHFDDGSGPCWQRVST